MLLLLEEETAGEGEDGGGEVILVVLVAVAAAVEDDEEDGSRPADEPLPAADDEFMAMEGKICCGCCWWEAVDGVVGAEEGVWPTLTKLSFKL